MADIGSPTDERIPHVVLREWLEALIQKTWLGLQKWYAKGRNSTSGNGIFHTTCGDCFTELYYTKGWGVLFVLTHSAVHWHDVALSRHLPEEDSLFEDALELYKLARASAENRITSENRALIRTVHQDVSGSVLAH